MNKLVLIVLFTVLAACGTHKHTGGCACPDKDGTAVPSVGAVKPASGSMLFPVTVYTYDLSLLPYAHRAIDSLNTAYLDAGIQFELKESKQFAFPEIDNLPVGATSSITN